MADLIAAVIGLIGVVIELCLHLVCAVLESLGFAIGHLASKPEEGERRFSAGRILVALTPLALLVSLVAGVWIYLDWSGKVRIARERGTKELLEAQVEQLAKNVDADGRLMPAAKLTVADAWGNPLNVTYEQTLLHETVAVASNGADGRAGTSDDLSAARLIMRPKKEIAMDALDKAKELIRERLKKREPE